MKAAEIRNLTDEEVQSKLRDAQQELFNLRVQQSSGQLEKPTRIREVRKDIARVQTIISERAAKAGSKA